MCYIISSNVFPPVPDRSSPTPQTLSTMEAQSSGSVWASVCPCPLLTSLSSSTTPWSWIQGATSVTSSSLVLQASPGNCALMSKVADHSGCQCELKHCTSNITLLWTTYRLGSLFSVMIFSFLYMASTLEMKLISTVDMYCIVLSSHYSISHSHSRWSQTHGTYHLV